MLQPLEPRCMMAAGMMCSDPLAQLQKVNSETAMTSPASIAPEFFSASTAEGVGELAQVGVQILNANGAVLSPVEVSGVREYTIKAGEKFSIRTRARDLNASPTGVFAVYTDIDYATVGNPST